MPAGTAPPSNGGLHDSPHPELREQLLANGRDPDADHVPVAKLFNPLGPGIWLATHLESDGDIL